MQRLDVNIVRVSNDCLSVCKNPVNKAHKVFKILEKEEFFILSTLRTRKNGTPNNKSYATTLDIVHTISETKEDV